MILSYICLMRMAAWPPLLIAALLLASCEQSAIDPSQSVVGAKKLPSAKVLSREIIYITRGYGTYGPGNLSFEFRPDDELTVTLSHVDRNTFKEVIDSKETLHLSSTAAADTRRALWRVRPGK